MIAFQFATLLSAVKRSVSFQLCLKLPILTSVTSLPLTTQHAPASTVFELICPPFGILRGSMCLWSLDRCECKEQWLSNKHGMELRRYAPAESDTSTFSFELFFFEFWVDRSTNISCCWLGESTSAAQTMRLWPDIELVQPENQQSKALKWMP